MILKQEKKSDEINFLNILCNEEFSCDCYDLFNQINFIEKGKYFDSFEVETIDNQKLSLKTYTPQKYKNEFLNGIFNCWDMRIYGGNITKLNENLNRNENVLIPNVNWEKTGKSILVYDLIEGKSIDECYDVLVAEKVVTLLFDMIFKYGFLHSNWDAKNIIITKDNKISFKNFGFFIDISIQQKIELRNKLTSQNNSVIEDRTITEVLKIIKELKLFLEKTIDFSVLSECYLKNIKFSNTTTKKENDNSDSILSLSDKLYLYNSKDNSYGKITKTNFQIWIWLLIAAIITIMLFLDI